MDSEYLENYVWIYVHAIDLDKGVVLWGIWLNNASGDIVYDEGPFQFSPEVEITLLLYVYITLATDNEA